MNRRLAPSIPAISFFLWWVVASLIFPSRLLNADGDLLRHIGHGEWMLRHHGLIHNDPFSFTMGGQPFVGFEYGSQIIYALVHRAAGLAGVAIFAGLLIAAAYALFARFLLRQGADPLLTYLATIVAAVLGASHWAARPHLFTLVLVVILLPMLEDGRETRDKGQEARLSWLPRPASLVSCLLLFALWANLHGGFVFGLVLIAIYIAGHAVEYVLNNDRAGELARIRRLAALFVAGFLGTLVNPHFLALHRHVLGFFGQKFIMDNTSEFLSPNFHDFFGKLLLAALLGLITILSCVRRRPHAAHLLVILAMIYFTLTSARNAQLLGVIVPAAMVLSFDDLWRQLPDWRNIRAVFQRDAPLGRSAPYVLATVVFFGFLALGRGRMFGMAVIPNEVSRDEFPVAVVERARAEHLTGRIFHSFVWGGYLIYAWPEQKVFIDGGTDFYGAELMGTWIRIANLGPFWRDSLARWDITLSLMPTQSAFTHELLREPGWRLHDCDATAALLQKVGGPAQPASADSLLASCSAKPATE